MRTLPDQLAELLDEIASDCLDVTHRDEFTLAAEYLRTIELDKKRRPLAAVVMILATALSEAQRTIERLEGDLDGEVATSLRQTLSDNGALLSCGCWYRAFPGDTYGRVVACPWHDLVTISKCNVREPHGGDASEGWGEEWSGGGKWIMYRRPIEGA